MGLRSRMKGKRMERRIATLFRSHWPEAVVRRASQAERAYESDVFITGGPPLLARLWLECNDERAPNPIAKLRQAEHDIGEMLYWQHGRDDRLPVVIWHATGARTIHATTRLWVLSAIRGGAWSSDAVVTMSVEDFLAELKGAV